MRLWLDCEYNGFRGALISLALVADDGREFYEVLPCHDPEPWVAEHVMPRLGKALICRPRTDPRAVLALKLQEFLMQFDRAHIVADWPEDISHFCSALVVGSGVRVNTPPLTRELRPDLTGTADVSAMPHNALEDARALARAGSAAS